MSTAPAQASLSRGRGDPEVTIIVPVYRDWARIPTLLAALSAQTLPADRYEIILVDNEPMARAVDLPLPENAQLLHEPRPGSYAARNRAVAAARGRFLAFTDADCLPVPGWLKGALVVLRLQPDIRITGPVSIFREPGGGYYPYLVDFHTAFRQQETAYKGTCVTANLIVAKATMEIIGQFNERLFSGGDYEWNRRAEAMGVPLLYLENVEVAHPARQTVREILRKKRRVAGSGLWGGEDSILTLLARGLRPPIHAFAKFDRAPLRWRDRLPLLGIMWLGRIVMNTETVLVRLGVKSANRS